MLGTRSISCLLTVAITYGLVASGCNGRTQTFACSSDDACVSEGIAGRCEATSFCSFPDPMCASGRRYGELAPPAQSQQCVPPGEGSTSTGQATTANPTLSTSSTESTSTSSTSEPPSETSTSSTSHGDGSTTSESDPGEPAVTLVWARSIGAPVDDDALDTDADFVGDIAVDSGGNVYAVGSFHGTIDLGSGPLIAEGDDDIWLASFTPEGKLRWASSYGSPGDDNAPGLALTQDGFVVIVGSFSGDPGFGDGPWQEGRLQAYAARFHPNSGVFVAAAAFPSTADSRFMKVAAGSGEDVCAVGGFFEAIELDQSHVSAGDEDIVVACLDQGLDVIRSWTAGGTGKDLGRSIAVATDGAIAIGSFYLASEEVATDDMEIRMFDADLGERWNRRFAAVPEAGSKVHRVAFLDGDVIAAGFIAAATTLGQPEGHAGGQDAFVMRLEGGKKGETIWAHTWGGRTRETASGLAIDAAGEIVVVGQVTDIPEILGIPVDAFGSNDFSVVKLSEDGDILWAQTYGSESVDVLEAVDIDARGRIYAGGRFRATLSIGDTALNAADATDALLMRLDP